MNRIMRWRPSPSMAVALLALFVALGGVAVAGQKSIKSGDPAGGDLTGAYPDPEIAAGAVKAPKLGDNAVNGTKVQDGTISGNDVADDSLTGDDVNEATLTVSGADIVGSVANADTVGGFDAGSLVKFFDPAGGDLTGTYPAPLIAAAAVTTSKLGDNAVTGAKVDDGTLTGDDIADESITAADLAPGVEGGPRAYARVISHDVDDCTDGNGQCTFDHSKGISSVLHGQQGFYCVVAPGIDSASVPAVATVELESTIVANPSVLIDSAGCNGGTDFLVATGAQPETNAVSGNTFASDSVGFTIMIP